MPEEMALFFFIGIPTEKITSDDDSVLCSIKLKHKGLR